MTYASERGFKVGEEYIVAKGLWKGHKLLFVRDDCTPWPEFKNLDEGGRQQFLHLDNFNTTKGNDYFDKTHNPKHILLRYIDEKYQDDYFLNYLVSLV